MFPSTFMNRLLKNDAALVQKTTKISYADLGNDREND